MASLQGTTDQGFDRAVTEFFAPGQTVEAIFGLPRDLTDHEIDSVGQYLIDNGLTLKSIELGSTPDWQYSMRLRFSRPSRPEGYALLPLIVLVIGALGAVGVTSYIGWKIGGGVGSIFDAITKNLIPIVLITTGAVVVMSYVTRPTQAKIIETGPEYVRAARGR